MTIEHSILFVLSVGVLWSIVVSLAGLAALNQLVRTVEFHSIAITSHLHYLSGLSEEHEYEAEPWSTSTLDCLKEEGL